MIRVLINYGGTKTNDRRIEPGDYAEGDPRLFGIADYLIANGHAVIVSEDANPFTPPDDGSPVFMTNIGVDEQGNPIRVAKRPVTQPGGDVLFIPAPVVEAFPEKAVDDSGFEEIESMTPNAEPMPSWMTDDTPEAAPAEWANTPEYLALVAARDAEMNEAGSDTRKLNRITADYAKRIQAAYDAWEASQSQ